MFQHLERLLGYNIIEQLQSSFQTKKQSFVDFFQSKSKVHKTLKQRDAGMDSDLPTAVVISLLIAYFKEEEKSILISYEILPDSGDLATSDSPMKPYVLFQGKEFYDSAQLMLVINRVILSQLRYPLSAITLSLGSYFIFDLSYPTTAGATMGCLQRVFLGINPSNGTKISRTKGQKIRSGVHEAVLSLVKDMAVYDITK